MRCLGVREWQPEVELLHGMEARWAEETGSKEEEELLVEDGQSGGRASAQLRKLKRGEGRSRVEESRGGGGRVRHAWLE